MAAEASEHDEIIEVHRCAAQRCPLAGTLKSGIGAGGSWLCRYHYRAVPHDWYKVSGAIRAALQNRDDPAAYVRQALKPAQQASVIGGADVAVL